MVTHKHSLFLGIATRHTDAMFNLSCRTCAQPFDVGPSSLASLHHTTDGLVGYARCPRGHLNVVSFHARLDPLDAASHVDAA